MAELIGGELARAAGLRVPELVLVDLDPVLGDAEPDPEVQDLLRASGGLNAGLDFLPGALPYAPGAGPATDPGFAAAVVWLDSLLANVDRTPRNPNLLRWHGNVWLIDHGAALYRQHAWTDPVAEADRPFAMAGEHVLLGDAGPLPAADAALAAAGRRGRRRGGRPPCPPTGSPRARRRSTPPTCTPGWPSRGPGSTPPRRSAVPRDPFQYVIVRVVPAVERGERLNAGVVLFCRAQKFLAARTALDPARLDALAPGCDAAAIADQLATIERIAAGDPAAGRNAEMPQADRFGLLAAPAEHGDPALADPHRPRRRSAGRARPPVHAARRLSFLPFARPPCRCPAFTTRSRSPSSPAR